MSQSSNSWHCSQESGRHNDSRSEGRSWSSLVDINDTDEVSSLVAHIADIEEPAAARALLDIEVPLLGVGSMPLWIRRPDGRRNRAGGCPQRTEIGKKYASAEIGAPKERRVVEDVVFDQPSGHRIVKYAVAGADRSFPFLKGIPSHAQARSKVLVVLARDLIAIGRIDSPNDDSVRGISCAKYQIAGCSKGGCVRGIIHRGVKRR